MKSSTVCINISKTPFVMLHTSFFLSEEQMGKGTLW